MKIKTEIQRSTVRLSEENVPAIYVSQFDFEASQLFAKAMAIWESDETVDNIFVYVSSYGGEIFPLLSMMDIIEKTSKNIHVIGMGCANSAAAILLSTGPQGNRWIGPNSYMHIHHVQGLIIGSTPELELQTKHIKQLDNHIMKKLVASSNLTMKEFKQILNEHRGEWQINAKEALKYGFVDNIGIPTIKKYEVWDYEV